MMLPDPLLFSSWKGALSITFESRNWALGLNVEKVSVISLAVAVKTPLNLVHFWIGAPSVALNNVWLPIATLRKGPPLAALRRVVL